MATRKQIEQARETRLWIRDIFIPAATAGFVIWNIPEARESIKAKYNKAKEFVKSKFQKKEN